MSSDEPEEPDLPLRAPAQFGRGVLRVHARRALAALIALVTIAAITGLTAGWHSGTFIAVETATLVMLLIGDKLVMPRLDRREQGNEGELKVARILASAEASGWRTLHDVSVGRGNIDHLVVGPGGIITIETKSRRGRIRADDLDPAWLRQAYAEKKAVEAVTGQHVDALLVLSDAFIVGKPVSRQRGVCVVPARMLAGHLARRPARLTEDEVGAIHARLALALNG